MLNAIKFFKYVEHTTTYLYALKMLYYSIIKKGQLFYKKVFKLSV
jgi:hypothetical protein